MNTLRGTRRSPPPPGGGDHDAPPCSSPRRRPLRQSRHSADTRAATFASRLAAAAGGPANRCHGITFQTLMTFEPGEQVAAGACRRSREGLCLCVCRFISEGGRVLETKRETRHDKRREPPC